MFHTITYRTAVEALTCYTSYFLQYGREMRLLIDLIYRFPGHAQSRTDFANEVRNTLEQAYEVARDHLQLAHKRQ